MSRVDNTRTIVNEYRGVELITGALKDISSNRLQELRKQFERNARFFDGIRDVYSIIKAHARRAGVAPKENAVEKTPARDIYIALTSNKHFYGMLNRDIVRTFIGTLRSSVSSDYLVIGQTGAQYFDETSVRGRVARTQFADDTPTQEEMHSVLSLILSYARVFVIYPKFVNPFRQDVAMTDITETPSAAMTHSIDTDYIFEPEIPKMLAFFEAQVRRALFERVILETELARTAARAVRMRDAKDRATNLKRTYERRLRGEIATLADIELMETFIGFNFWKQ